MKIMLGISHAPTPPFIILLTNSDIDVKIVHVAFFSGLLRSCFSSKLIRSEFFFSNSKEVA